jgi:hypothetical protein
VTDEEFAVVPSIYEGLTSEDRDALARAVKLLENPGFVARLADHVGVPIDFLLKKLPSGTSEAVKRSVSTVLERCMDAALFRFETKRRLFRSEAISKIAVAATGATAGAFGLAALPIELPVTTSLMLRSVAEIARSEGEDVHSAEGRVACLEVLALGGSSTADDDTDIGYFAVRAALAQEVTAAVRFLNSATGRQSAPALIRLMESVAARFGIVVSEKVAAGAVPVIGALGSATINTLFMDHYQDMAHGHFAVRRLERKYGPLAVRQLYGWYREQTESPAVEANKG